MTVLITNATANPIVQRFRLRSTSEPPPNGPAPVPTPNAPDSPDSLPECITIRNSSPPCISRRLADGNARRRRRTGGLGNCGAPASQRGHRPQRDQPAAPDDQRAQPDPGHERIDDQQELARPWMRDEPVRD